MKKRILATLMALCLLIFPITVSASEIPFLALGKDLNDEQLEYVLSEMGISKDDLENYTVVYITNDMEHEMLDSYIDPSVIGSHSLSSVMVKKNEEGYGIKVTTKNINYCTISMYQNALLTAGVEDADVLVVGPYPISGTAALVGAWMVVRKLAGPLMLFFNLGLQRFFFLLILGLLHLQFPAFKQYDCHQHQNNK